MLVLGRGGFGHSQQGDAAELVGDGHDADFGDRDEHVEAFEVGDVAQHGGDLLAEGLFANDGMVGDGAFVVALDLHVEQETEVEFAGGEDVKRKR